MKYGLLLQILYQNITFDTRYAIPLKLLVNIISRSKLVD